MRDSASRIKVVSDKGPVPKFRLQRSKSVRHAQWLESDLISTAARLSNKL